MGEVVIKVENISKQYRLGQVGTKTLAEDIRNSWAKLRGKQPSNGNPEQENDLIKKERSNFLWALRDINFDVKQGEIVGIIGKNGAGKSTLLKILSRVTTPTKGSIKVNGRIASLLEVGTGFHPDMSGRDNVFLNGAILGMTKQEIKKKFDEIVDFSGVERFIDTPVKRYSSGMYVRLAFAVAAHLEPEILIVDEVLAVGDAEFQKKCLGKMKSVSGEGRTILFVSHNMDAVSALCTRAVYLVNGGVDMDGKINEVINHYILNNSRQRNLEELRSKGMGEKIKLVSLETGADNNFFHFGEDLKFKAAIQAAENCQNIKFVVGIFNGRESSVGYVLLEGKYDFKKDEIRKFDFSVKCGGNLSPDSYLTAFSIIQGDLLKGYQNLDSVMGSPIFDIIPAPGKAESKTIMNWNKGWGNIIFPGSINEIKN